MKALEKKVGQGENSTKDSIKNRNGGEEIDAKIIEQGCQES